MAAPNELSTRYGPWALVAGASEGIGLAFADALAAAGLSVALVARRPAPLAGAAERLAAAHRVETLAIAADLGDDDAPDAILAALGAREVGLLVYNAALSVSGPYLDVPLATHHRALRVNCLAPLALVHALAGPMRARGRGGVVLMSSLTGAVGGACLATYSGTKAFGAVFGEALWDELRGAGVDIVVSQAGATLTPGYEATAPAKLPALAPRPMRPEAVVADALRALGRRPVTIPGRGNRVAAFFLRHFMTRRRAVLTMGAAGREVHAAAARAAEEPPR